MVSDRPHRGAESLDRVRAEMPLGDPFVFRSAPLVSLGALLGSFTAVFNC